MSERKRNVICGDCGTEIELYQITDEADRAGYALDCDCGDAQPVGIKIRPHSWVPR